eukprot:8862733-Alexandrium_andersonii.AAC.1
MAAAAGCTAAAPAADCAAAAACRAMHASIQEAGAPTRFFARIAAESLDEEDAGQIYPDFSIDMWRILRHGLSDGIPL